MTLSKSDIDTVLSIAKSAGEEIMRIYKSNDFGVAVKSDDSPLTKADTAANRVIVEGLQKSFNLPIVSEEDEESHYTKSNSFWLIDPLDGTKEFIKRNDEFTVNIALIENKQPVFGVVYAPALNKLYWTNEQGDALRSDESQQAKQIRVDDEPVSPKAVVSRSHMDDTTQKLLDDRGITESVSAGSSLKFCLVAEGSAHLYPRLAPTMIWDTAAADAVTRAAGARVYNYENSAPLTYSTDQLKNPYFICTSLKA